MDSNNVTEVERITSEQSIIDPDYAQPNEEQEAIHTNPETPLKDNSQRDKISGILTDHINTEINGLENDIYVIDQRLNQTRLVLDRLRAAMLISYYDRSKTKSTSQSSSSGAQSGIHPAIKAEIGKSLPQSQKLQFVSTDDAVKKPSAVMSKSKERESKSSHLLSASKHRVIVGNVSKYIPADSRQKNDQSTHKWMVYVRGPRESPDISHVVEKIWFFLHPTYKPNDLVEIKSPPFHLTRRGWGEFPVRVQLHLKDARSRKVDIIHHLKLDSTYTGNQNLGAETHVDVTIEPPTSEDSNAVLPVTHQHKDFGQINGLPRPESSTASTDAADQTISHASPEKAPRNKADTEVTVKSEPSEPGISPEKKLVTESPKENIVIENRKREYYEDDSSDIVLNSKKVKHSALASAKSRLNETSAVVGKKILKIKSTPRPSSGEPAAQPDSYSKPGLSNKTAQSKTLTLNANPQTVTPKFVSLLNPSRAPTTPKTPNGFSPSHAQPKPIAGRMTVIPGTNNIQLSLKGSILSSNKSSPQPFSNPTTSNPQQASKPVFMKCKLPTGKVLLIPQNMFKKVQGHGSNGFSINLPVKPRPKPPPTTAKAPGKPDPAALMRLKPKQLPVTPINLRSEHKLPYLDLIPDMDSLMHHLAKIHSLIAEGKRHHSALLPTAESYLSWPKGKQRALEWQRAKSISEHQTTILRQNHPHFKDIQPWSTKRITLWCRRYLYTPCSEGDIILKVTPCVGRDQRELLSLAMDKSSLPRSNVEDNGGVVSIDIGDEIPTASKESKKKSEKVKADPPISYIVQSTKEERYVEQLASQVGVKLGHSVSGKGVSQPLTASVMWRAYARFMEDIIRRTNSPCTTRQQSEISNVDVISAIRSHKDYEFLNDFVAQENDNGNDSSNDHL